MVSSREQGSFFVQVCVCVCVSAIECRAGRVCVLLKNETYFRVDFPSDVLSSRGSLGYDFPG